MENINGFYDDNGNKINTFLVKKPGLCLLCKKGTSTIQWNTYSAYEQT